MRPNSDRPDLFQLQWGLLAEQLAFVPRYCTPRNRRSGIHEQLLCEGKELHLPAKNPAQLRCQHELRMTVLEIKIKTRRTFKYPIVVLGWISHGEGSVSPSASAKLALQPLALPRHHPACAMPIQSGSRTCGTSFDSCATLRTCRNASKVLWDVPYGANTSFPKRSHHV